MSENNDIIKINIFGLIFIILLCLLIGMYWGFTTGFNEANSFWKDTINESTAGWESCITNYKNISNTFGLCVMELKECKYTKSGVE